MAVILLAATGCGGPAKEPPVVSVPSPTDVTPLLVAIGPASTVAGQSFNTQSDGRAALGVQAKDITSSAVIVFGSKVLETAHGTDFLSATVPKELFSQPGKIPVFIRDVGGESNRIDFEVKPAK